MEADLKKTMEECRRLTTEISTLKEENEILRVGIIYVTKGKPKTLTGMDSILPPSDRHAAS